MCDFYLNAIKPSVSGMMQRLARAGLVNYEPYRPLSLTPAGEAQALQLLRRQRLWEVMLYCHLQVPWEIVMQEACCLEHGTSLLVEENLAAFLGHPPVCPHGFPIPDAQGRVCYDDSVLLPLYDLEPGQRCVVRRVPERPLELLVHLKEVGIRPGQALQVVAVKRKTKVISVELDQRLDLAQDIISNVLVELL